MFSCVKKGTKLRIADFVHGSDGLGNQNFEPPQGNPIELSAAEFMVEQANLHTPLCTPPFTHVYRYYTGFSKEKKITRFFTYFFLLKIL